METEEKHKCLPTVYCLKEEKEVPIWWCIGSLSHHREPCRHLVYAEVRNGQLAKFVCSFKHGNRLARKEVLTNQK